MEELGQELSAGESTSAPSAYIPWLFKSGLSPEEVSAHLSPVSAMLDTCNCNLVTAAPCEHVGTSGKAALKLLCEMWPVKIQ